ncbi:dipeptidase [Catenulispora sp. NF23]|uniref:Dipeptidase n=1 Tax=Catenulispora pinistramenti TaxID=2705254 RepID=A0ABS5KK53_9ACTN|nr:dipeptidase [Catenulispora pinistramenti]MBS2545891.1 dipeptidase [Catenulispora pinistramenti]
MPAFGTPDFGTPDRLDPATLELHRRAVVADTHNDLLCSVVLRPVAQWPGYFRAQWLPQLRAGGVDIQVLPVYIDDAYRPEGALRETLRMIEAAHRIAEGNADEVSLCLDGADIDRALAAGRIALVLALEGAPGVDADIELFATLYRLGVRIASLAHFGRTALADGSGEDAAGSRLTAAGVEALAEMERLGMMFDVSHLGAAGVDHVLELATRPVLATHSSARALRDHHRNLTDARLAAIAAGGGVVCVNFFPGFVDAHEPSISRLVDHIEHIGKVAGTAHVGIGPDFVLEVLRDVVPGGVEVGPVAGCDPFAALPGLAGPAGLPLLTAELLARGLDEAVVAATLGGNVLRLFRAELGVPADRRGAAA